MARPDTACFVQFPHPGAELAAAADEVPWNTGGHRRKFILADGRWSDGDEVTEGALVFWGEWEAPSTVVRRWPAEGRLPRVLHQPWWPSPAPNRARQNTDPWVFGARMRYSNCKQATWRGGRTSMQRLGRGSVICFGSTIAGQFCLDTVFVVDSAEPWQPRDAASVDTDAAFRACTVGALAATPWRDVGFTLYRGATIEDPVAGMFSFVPARPADAGDPRFARPAISGEYINPASRQSTWGSRRSLPLERVHDQWAAVHHQVLAAGLVAGVSVQSPPPNAVLAVDELVSGRPGC